MANRTCPICSGKIAAAAVVACSYEIVCPHCGTTLELSRVSRVLASLVGLGVGWLVFGWAGSRHWGGTLDWVVPLVCAFLAFGILAPIFLMFSSDLIVKPDLPSEPLVQSRGSAASTAPGHGAHH